MFLVLVSSRKVRFGMPQLAGTVPLRTGTGVHAFLMCICVSLSRRFSASFFYRGLLLYSRFQENALDYDNIINVTSI